MPKFDIWFQLLRQNDVVSEHIVFPHNVRQAFQQSTRAIIDNDFSIASDALVVKLLVIEMASKHVSICRFCRNHLGEYQTNKGKRIFPKLSKCNESRHWWNQNRYSSIKRPTQYNAAIYFSVGYTNNWCTDIGKQNSPTIVY